MRRWDERTFPEAISGGAFAGAVVKLVEAGAPVKAVINYYGEDSKTFNGYYVKEDSPIRTARDFIGKKIAVNTLGAHAEAVINTYLRKNGLNAEEIKQVQLVVVPHLNLAQQRRRQHLIGTCARFWRRGEGRDPGGDARCSC